MAHHQHHGAAYDAQVSRSLESRPHGPPSGHMPAISEDEFANELDEPPDHLIHSETFAKTRPSSNIRRQSLLTKALHTDSESHDEQPLPNPSFTHLPSVSSTCSNFSSRSHDFTSDDGLISPSTRASTPGSPQSILHLPKQFIAANQVPKIAEPTRALAQSADEAPPPKEPTVEAQLGRKRCITFACGGSTAPVAKKEESPPRAKAPEPAKRPCVIKFNCPFTSSKAAKSETTRVSRHLSPAPVGAKTGPSGLHRRHRDSDSTIKSESPKAPQVAIPEPSKRHRRRPSNLSDLGRTEACRFHEFASSDEEVQEWTQQSTCYKSRLTVNDTLKQENHIRRLAEEADEEEAEEGARGNDDDDMAIDEDVEDFSDDDVSDEGFQTDDEDGFAESDDDDDDDSDYEWWAPRRTRAASPYVGSAVFRPVIQRNFSDSSLDLSDQEQSLNLQRGRRRVRKPVEPVTIRPGTPELPDSTDFVCGTLDEDRPLEQAYISRINERKAAKHRTTPQDIDPSFPTSDPEIENDDEEDDDGEDEEEFFGRDVNESDNAFLHGRLETTDRDEPRGRRSSPVPPRSPKVLSPKRLRSPAPSSSKRGALPKSPCPKGMFYRHSPGRMRSPPPPNKLTSPPPSRRGSTASGMRPAEFSFDHTFLASRDQNVTHTSSLPRSPHPFIRRRRSSTVECEPCMAAAESDEDEGESTEHAKPYTRGAIDIAQGLERKRLKRREKFYRQYLKKEEKKKARRPLPGKGAQRMRQVGLECATLRGKRMLSI